jgi:hypothetical protein
MNIQEQFAKAFGVTTKLNTIQSVNSRRIQGGPTVTTSSNGMNVSTLGVNTLGGSYVMGNGSVSSPQFGQPSFGSSSGVTSGSFTNKPSHPFEFLDSIEKAKLIKAFLIERGVNTINKETADALFLVSCVLKDQVLPPVKQAKKKLII